jgi:FkbM family methyltransferase
MITIKLAAKIARMTGLNRLKIVKQLGHKLAARQKVVKTYNGVFSLPVGDLGLVVNGDYEPLTLGIARKIIKKGDTVLDIGAHIGWHTVAFSKMVGKGEVIAFEPDIEIFPYLLANINQNCCDNVWPVPYAVSDSSGEDKLFISRKGVASSMLSKRGKNPTGIAIAAVKLDEFLPSEKKISFAKIDVEGWEPHILKGMERIIKENNIAIVIEFTGAYLKKLGVDMGEYKKLLSQFELTAINELDEKRVYPITLDELFETEKQLNVLLKKPLHAKLLEEVHDPYTLIP